MTEETDTETDKQKTQVSAEVEQLMADNAAMKAKMDELLTEAKKAKQAKSSVDAEEILESIALGSKVMWDNVRDLLSDQ